MFATDKHPMFGRLHFGLFRTRKQCAHAPQTWPWWRWVSVKICHLAVHLPSTGRAIWIYTRWGAVAIDVYIDRREMAYSVFDDWAANGWTFNLECNYRRDEGERWACEVWELVQSRRPMPGAYVCGYGRTHSEAIAHAQSQVEEETRKDRAAIVTYLSTPATRPSP